MTAPAAVPQPGDWCILVAAHEHPDCDEWVTERAQAEAHEGGLILGEYLGREDALGERRQPDMCCHVFAATKLDAAVTDLSTVAEPGDPLRKMDARRLDAANDILVGCVENGPWVLIEDPALRELVSRYVADVAYEVADAVGLNEARNAALQLRGDRRLPMALPGPAVPPPGDHPHTDPGDGRTECDEIDKEK